MSADHRAGGQDAGVRQRLVLLAPVIGVVDGLVFLGFEWLVKHGGDWIWDDLAGSDDARWRVVPLALALSLAYSAVLRARREPRVTRPDPDLLDAAREPPPPTLDSLATILLVGLASLLAGASLGPEAPLVAFSTAVGTWAATRARLGTPGGVLAMASVGALLVAFFGSLIPLAIPLLLVYQRTKRLALPAVVAIALAGLAAYGTLWLVEGNDDGFGSIPVATVRVRDYAAAVVLGVIAVGVGALLRWCSTRLARTTLRIEQRLPWWLAAAAFGAVLGLLYLAGGQSVQFSGSEGIALLLSGELHYGAWALAGLALVKLLATGWSLSAGYRGGLVFPSVYVGVAVSLCADAALPHLAGPGILLGCTAGLLVVMTSPVPGAVMLLALLPFTLLPLGLAGALGAIAARAALTRLRPAR